jgi:hypothetical protein
VKTNPDMTLRIRSIAIKMNILILRMACNYCDGKEVKLVSLDGAESVIYESELYADAVLGIQ